MFARGRRSRRSRVGLLSCVVLLLVAGRAAGQQQQQQKPDSLKTRAELIMDRLRTVRPLIADTTSPDSATLDSLRQDSLRRIPGRVPRPTSSIQRDSIMTELLQLRGFSFTEYKADSARFDTDSSRLDLLRQAEVLRDGQLVAADTSIIFSQTTSIACAHGKPTVSGAGAETPISADSLCYNINTKRGVAYDMETQITEGANWIVHSRQSFTVGDTLYSHGGWFTDCNLPEPHYHFAAGEMKYIGRDVIVARNVTFNFQDVPVFWLPFFVQSTKQGRRSGILTPQFGVNDIARQNAGYQRKIENVGLYWAVSENFGATLALDWRSNDLTKLRGTVDYRFLRQFLAGSISYGNIWKAEGGRDFTLATRTDWQPDERTRLNGDVSYASSTRLIRERSIDPRELNQQIRSNVGVNRRFDWGTLNLSGSRSQQISDSTVDMTLPSLTMSFPSLTLFEAVPGDAKWYSNITWNGALSGRRATKSVSDYNVSRGARGRSEITSDVRSSFTLGKLGISQGVQYSDVTDRARFFPGDTTLQPLPERGLRKLTWNTGINFQQRLIGTTTLTPGLSMRGELVEGDTTGGERVAAPTRIDFNASLRTDLYRFYPGFFGLQTLRHRLSPSFTYSYSPEPTVTDRQRDVFGAINVREQNRLSIGLSQTWEGKPNAPPDTAAADSAAQAAQLARDTASGPRRRQTVQPIQLLSINTDAVVYDFVQAREGNGVQTTEIGNNIQSDLFRGLQLSFAHDLFREKPQEDATQPPEREFAPHLSRVSASFQLNADSWLARAIGLGRRRNQQQQQPGRQGAQQQLDAAAADTGRVAPDIRETGQDFGLIGAGRDRDLPRMDVGNWTASFNYTLFRPRDEENSVENQMLTANISLQPTAQWALNWSTGYSFTKGEFTDHILTLTRQLHDWDANFDFVKAQNGNFSFQFRVKLRANPDIKLDYEQRELTNFNTTGR